MIIMPKIYYSCYVGNLGIYPNTYWEENNPNTGKKIKGSQMGKYLRYGTVDEES